MYPVFGMKVSTYFLGASEWLFGALLLAGFWNKKLGILGAIGSVVTFLCTVTIIPFMPNGWAPSAGGFPAMEGNVASLMKDVVLLAVSFYLLKQDLVRRRFEPTSLLSRKRRLDEAIQRKTYERKGIVSGVYRLIRSGPRKYEEVGGKSSCECHF